MQRLVDGGHFPGIMTMVYHRGELVHYAAVGQADIEADKPLARDTIFRIYSMSKPITAVATLMLMDEGRFLLSNPVSAFIPEFADARVFVGGTGRDPLLTKAERPITIRHLLTHTAGLAYGLTDESPVDALYRQLLGKAQGKRASASVDDFLTDRLVVPLSHLVADLAKLPLANHPGAQWRYSIAMAVLGRVVEVASDMPYERFLQERLFGPLEMVDTGFHVPPEKLDRFAALYVPKPQGGLHLVDAPQQSRIWREPAICPMGGEMLVSTADDYMRFAGMLLNGGELDGARILGRKTVELMASNHLAPALMPHGWPANPQLGKGYGLGVDVVLDVAQTQVPGSVGAFSWGGAASTAFWVDPREQLVGLMMTQVLATPVPLGEQFRVLAYQALT
jgi:CubicO group peptidase (beta-lactamase class C family)